MEVGQGEAALADAVPEARDHDVDVGAFQIGNF
jgi:hypothetical protein